MRLMVSYCILFLVSQVHDVWCARWKSFHMPVMSAAFMLHPEFCQRDWTNLPEQTEDLNKVMQEMATEEHKFGAMSLRTQPVHFF